MMKVLLEAALWAAVVSTGLMAGIYVAFSVFIMSSFKTLPDETVAASMIAINKVILKSAFMPLFFGSSALALLQIFVVADSVNQVLTALAGVIYLVGMLLCTVVFNVPLNNRLLHASLDDQATVWQQYAIQWTRWNHVRTISSVLAFIFYLDALKAF